MIQTNNYNITTRGMKKNFNPLMNKTHQLYQQKRNEMVENKTKRTNNKKNIIPYDENQLPLAHVTKKISKVAYNMTNQKIRQQDFTPTRKPFKDLTNKNGGYSDSSNEKTPKISTKFLEDDALTEKLNQGAKTAQKSHHHAVISYTLPNSFKQLQFSCFLDRELNIPEKYVSKTITHSVDNDVETDDGQIESAIRNVSKSVEDAYEENKRILESQQKNNNKKKQQYLSDNSNQKSSISMSA